MLTPSFHFRILDDSMAVFNRCAGKLVDILGKEGKDVDAFPYITRCTLDIMLEAAMGKRLDVQGGIAVVVAVISRGWFCCCCC